MIDQIGTRVNVWRSMERSSTARRLKRLPAAAISDGLARGSRPIPERTLRCEHLAKGRSKVPVIGELVGSGKGSGIEVKRPTAQVWTVPDGQAARWEYGFKDGS